MRKLTAAKPVIGVVGGVGSGKSTAAAQFARLGCALVDADRIGHELLAQPDVMDELRRHWGGRVFDSRGRVDRRALGDDVFEHPQQLAALNAILHPRIRRRMAEQIARACGDADVRGVVVDAALLFEAGCDDLCTHVVFLNCPAAERLRRVSRCRGWDESTWRGRENSQIPLDKKAQMCDYSVDSSSSAAHLAEQISDVFDRIADSLDRS